MAAPKHILFREIKHSPIRCLIEHGLDIEILKRECYWVKEYTGREALTDDEIEALAEASIKYELRKRRGNFFP